MSSPPPATTSEPQTELRELVRWMLAALGCECHDEQGTLVVQMVPEPLRTKVGCGSSLRLSFSAAPSSESTHLMTLESPLVRSLVEVLRATQIIGRAVPARQAESVRDVSQRLFDEYTVEGGSVHLGGCTLEDRPLLRVSYIERSAVPDKPLRLRHHFIHPTGAPLDATFVERLGLTQLVPPTRTIRVADDQCAHWAHVGAAALQRLAHAPHLELLLTTVIWCKYAEGKLEFVIGEATKSIVFSGWAQLLVDGIERPPPLTCSSYPQGSYHLAATDAGEIVPYEAIATCAVSGQRVLSDALETCQATGARALPEFFVHCPASGVRVLEKALVVCETCQQLVSPTACEATQCNACRSLGRISKNDPRMARLLGEYPGLDRWPRWKLAETATAYVLLASSLVKRLLLVVDKNDLKALRLAKGSRFSTKWTEASEVDRTAYLR